MKTFTAILALAFISIASANLQNDLEELADLMPVGEFRKLADEYIKKDREFLKLLLYVKGNDFKNLWVDVLAEKEVQDIVMYCEDHDVPAIEAINKVADFVGLPHYPQGFMHPRMLSSRITGGIAGAFKDFDALVPYPELKKAMDAKYEQSADFKGLMDLIKAEDIETFVKENKNAQKFLKFLKDYKVDVATYWSHVKDLLKH